MLSADDIRSLFELLNGIGIVDYQAALATITRYYPLERFPQKTLYVLEDLLVTP